MIGFDNHHIFVLSLDALFCLVFNLQCNYSVEFVNCVLFYLTFLLYSINAKCTVVQYILHVVCLIILHFCLRKFLIDFSSRIPQNCLCSTAFTTVQALYCWSVMY